MLKNAREKLLEPTNGPVGGVGEKPRRTIESAARIEERDALQSRASPVPGSTLS
jgi:hypothetical protein